MNRHPYYHRADVELANLSKVFADPVNVALLTILTSKNHWLKQEELTMPGINDQQLLKNLKVLKKSGLLQTKIEGKERRYSICAENFEKVCHLFLNFFQ